MPQILHFTSWPEASSCLRGEKWSLPSWGPVSACVPLYFPLLWLGFQSASRFSISVPGSPSSRAWVQGSCPMWGSAQSTHSPASHSHPGSAGPGQMGIPAASTGLGGHCHCQLDSVLSTGCRQERVSACQPHLAGPWDMDSTSGHHFPWIGTEFILWGPEKGCVSLCTCAHISSAFWKGDLSFMQTWGNVGVSACSHGPFSPRTRRMKNWRVCGLTHHHASGYGRQVTGPQGCCRTKLLTAPIPASNEPQMRSLKYSAPGMQAVMSSRPPFRNEGLFPSCWQRPLQEGWHPRRAAISMCDQCEGVTSLKVIPASPEINWAKVALKLKFSLRPSLFLLTPLIPLPKKWSAFWLPSLIPGGPNQQQSASSVERLWVWIRLGLNPSSTIHAFMNSMTLGLSDPQFPSL